MGLCNDKNTSEVLYDTILGAGGFAQINFVTIPCKLPLKGTEEAKIVQGKWHQYYIIKKRNATNEDVRHMENEVKVNSRIYCAQ